MDSDFSSQDFGKFIRGARVKAGLTQLSLGVDLGFASGQFISNLERGLRTLPPKHVPKLSRALNVDQDELLRRLFQVHTKRIQERSQSA